MKILFIGASSYVGARIYFDLKKDFDILGTYNSSRLSSDFVHLNITDEIEVKEVFEKIRPEVVIHAANNASSAWCEANLQEAILLNQTSTQSIVEATNAVGAKIVYLSSIVAVNPINTYGKTKLESEKIVKKAEYGWLILRPSLILGYSPNTTNDRPFNRLLKNLDEGTQAIYENAWVFQPTYIGNISEVIKGCLEKNIWGEIIPIVVPEKTTRFKSARDILKTFGIKAEIDKTAKKYFKDTEVGLDKLKEHGLPTYSYKETIEKIVDEIKHRKKFVLQKLDHKRSQ